MASLVRGPLGKALIVTAIAVGALGFVFVRYVMPPSAPAHEEKVFAADGVIKSFGPDRAYVNIAHKKIDGFMDAMTMSFEIERPEQAAGFEVNDAVHFTFGADRGGRLVIRSMTKEGAP